MTPEAFRLFRALADGQPLNGANYAEAAGTSRTAVWKQVERLRRAGLPVAAVRGTGYRLPWPVCLLDEDQIRRAGQLDGIGLELRQRVDSTNSTLLDDFRHRHALVAEYQEGGRGRRGRGWISPPGCGVYLSFGYRFDCGLQRLGALSLIAGVAVAEEVARAGIAVGLKWPNDLVVADSKLGGLLVEIRGASEGPCEVVVGAGVNVRLPRDEDGSGDFTPPDQRWTDLHAAGGDLNRNRLVGRLVAGLDAACGEFEQSGFGPFAQRWQALDALRGRRVRVVSGNAPALEGVADGVTGQGMLRVVHNGSIRELNAGEVSVRAE